LFENAVLTSFFAKKQLKLNDIFSALTIFHKWF